MASRIPRNIDTVIIGNGPSSLILSYILHGHIPYYEGHHHDSLLHTKLLERRNLLDLTPDLYEHFQSSLRYSTQALPLNILLDTLIRPNADTEISPQSCIEWKPEPGRAVDHIILGDAPSPGGQWAENPVSASCEIGTLSYAEMLSLPGYSFEDHYMMRHGEPMPEFVRPTRAEVADYFKAYPAAVGISDVIHNSTHVEGISRSADGFYIASHGITCRHLVLASGIFSVNLPPPSLLAPIAKLNSELEPLLVIGSGFSAADVIISAPPTRKIIHMFHWSPDTRPSPLKGCHHQAYPEYAGVYRQMKLATIGSGRRTAAVSPLMRRKSNPFVRSRDWETTYEGLPNAEVLVVNVTDGHAVVRICLESGDVVYRTVGGLQYVVGRRGSLGYLEDDLRQEVLESDESADGEGEHSHAPTLISARTLRAKAEVDLEVASDVFITGSLTGDSLVRHAFGGCVYAAGKIIKSSSHDMKADCDGTEKATERLPTVRSTPFTSQPSSGRGSPIIRPNGTAHDDLHLDRRKLTRAVDTVSAQNKAWQDSGWWGGGGCLVS